MEGLVASVANWRAFSGAWVISDLFVDSGFSPVFLAETATRETKMRTLKNNAELIRVCTFVPVRTSPPFDPRLTFGDADNPRDSRSSGGSYVNRNLQSV